MAGPGLDWLTVQEIIGSEDERFEELVNSLIMKELLDLVSGLQSSMADEQRRFDDLRTRLDHLGFDGIEERQEGETLSVALCSSQMRLARLCARNMRCFTQQAVRAKEQHNNIAADADSRSTSSVVEDNNDDQEKQAQEEPVSGGSPVRPFYERLRFFQRQEGQQEPQANVPPGAARRLWSANGEWTPNAPGVEPRKGEATVLDEDDENASSVMCRDNSDAISDFRSRSESDFDVSDFVVHRTTFAEDDAYDSASAVEEDSGSPVRIVPIRIEVDEPLVVEPEPEPEPLVTLNDLDDSVEQEDDSERTVSQEGESETEEEDFVDNSAQYMSDPRRYVYYPEETELEVILEEDENEASVEEETQEEEDGDDDEEDDDEESDGRSSCTVGSVVRRVVPSSQEVLGEIEIVSRRKDSTDLGLSSDDDNTKTISMETYKEGHDSGLADDHASSSSTAEELDEPLSSCSSADKHVYQLVSEIKSPSPLPRLEETLVPSQEDPPTVPPPPLPNFVPVNGHYKQQSYITDNNEMVDEDEKLSSSVEAPKNIRNNGHLAHLNENGEQPKILVKPRSSTLHWDPTDLLCELYKPAQINERSDCRGLANNNENPPITLEGYLETIPSGKRKATYWNAWKRLYFRVHEGHMHCYNGSYSEEPRTSVLLMGGVIERLDNDVIGIDDRRGRYWTLRCQSSEETDDWFDVLTWHSQENFSATYVQPVAYPMPNRKSVIIVDLGGCSTRAGILMDQATLPQVFFPNVCATDKFNYKRVFGSEALLPHVRQLSNLNFPVQPTAKITKYTIDVEALPELFKKVFTELNVDPKQYTIAVSVPRTLSPQTQLAIARLLIDDYGAQGVNLTHQGLLTLYAYRATSGIVLDIGDRLDIIPVSEGYIVENGITRLPYGGGRIAHHLNHTLAHKQISLVSEVESYLLRYLLEQGCYVAQDYEEELERCRYDPESLEKTISVEEFFQDEPPFKSVTLDFGRFHAPEGLFTPKLWGLDSPGLGKLVHRAIQECGMDVRREMARSIFLSGGVTCLPGFAQRLEKELDKLTPSSVTPKVHASPYRNHMSFLGACQMALSSEFRHVCISREEWRSSSSQQRGSLLRRWHL